MDMIRKKLGVDYTKMKIMKAVNKHTKRIFQNFLINSLQKIFKFSKI